MATSSGSGASVRTIAIVAAVIAALALGTTLYTLASHATTSTASQGVSGPPGPPGPPGHNGTNGTGGSARTWATFAPTFVMNGTLGNVSMTTTPCFTPGSGAYECNVTFAISGWKDVEFQGVNSTPGSGFYFAGSNPSTDWLMDEGHNYTFQLWFQVVASEGTLTPALTLHIGELSRS